MTLRIINLGGVIPTERRIDLRDLGFEYRVSDEARAEIEANERRALRVLQTAHRYWLPGQIFFSLPLSSLRNDARPNCLTACKTTWHNFFASHCRTVST